jgi:hypothetical protein
MKVTDSLTNGLSHKKLIGLYHIEHVNLNYITKIFNFYLHFSMWRLFNEVQSDSMF